MHAKMKSLGVLPLLCSAIALANFACAADKCDLTKALKPVQFPDLEKMIKAQESLQMSVEYTVPDSQQTDYYVEYYDIAERRGRVDGHQEGKASSYLYFTQSYEAWNLGGRTCEYQNISQTPKLLRHDQSEWWYMAGDDDDDEDIRTKRVFGPSGMFKYALDVWNGTQQDSEMGYMGESDTKIRGLKAHYWRRCDTPTSYIDYYFSLSTAEDPLEVKMKNIPLRVYFGGTREGKEKELMIQQYDILYFQPFISKNVKPFELPKGIGCKRGPKFEPPKAPNFSESNLQFSAEVIYRKVDFNEKDVQYYSYYSTLKMALDLRVQHLSYSFTQWSKSSDKDIDSPEYVIYDMKHGYAYTTDVLNGTCTITREKSFIPKYRLPGDAGSISLTDPSVLFPNSELSFVSTGENRGLKVNIFEEIVENYMLDKKDKTIQIPKAIITHSYLTDDEEVITTGATQNALVQIQLRLSGRYDKVIELLTFNFYGFSTNIQPDVTTYDIRRCFKNDDDYSWVDIGFNADQDKLNNIKADIPEIQANIRSLMTLKTELNDARIPYVLVDMTDYGIAVNILVLGKPPVLLDYLEPEMGKTITGTKEVEGIQDDKSCAQTCLEVENNCWGFSICGSTCSYGVGESATVTSKNNCKLYRRYNNDTYIPSRESTIENLRREVETHQVKLMLKGKDDSMVEIEASSFSVIDVAMDDYRFHIGFSIDPRFTTVKVGYKLKESTGTPVKNLGNLRYDQCQRVCLDFKECESVSFCSKNSECLLSVKYGDELKDDEMEINDLCIVLTRKYRDNFERSPGNVLSITAKEVLDLDSAEKCARACIRSKGYECLSFDHCPQDEKGGCRLHTVHFPNSKTREDKQTKSINCGHYYRKYSTEFKKSANKRIVGSSVPPLYNVTLEECSKSCMDYGKGTCYGFDFCQQNTLLGTSCFLFDSDPSRLKSAYSDICTNYLRTEPQFAPRPYTTGYAGGIGFLCFVIGLVVGAVVVFAIAYFRVNRR